jgi:hypothetical protein
VRSGRHEVSKKLSKQRKNYLTARAVFSSFVTPTRVQACWSRRNGLHPQLFRRRHFRQMRTTRRRHPSDATGNLLPRLGLSQHLAMSSFTRRKLMNWVSRHWIYPPNLLQHSRGVRSSLPSTTFVFSKRSARARRIETSCWFPTSHPRCFASVFVCLSLAYGYILSNCLRIRFHIAGASGVRRTCE